MIATALAVLASILLTYLFVDRENQTAKEKISALNDTQDSKAEDVAAIKTTRFRRIAVFTALQLTLIGSLLSKQTSASSTANEAIEKYEDLKSSVLRLADASSVDSALGLLRESATSLSLNETRETAAAAYRGFLSPIADQLAAYEKTIKDLELSCRAAEGPGKIVDKILLVAFVQSTHTTTVDAQSRLPELIASHFRASDLPTLVPALPPVMPQVSNLRTSLQQPNDQTCASAILEASGAARTYALNFQALVGRTESDIQRWDGNQQDEIATIIEVALNQGADMEVGASTRILREQLKDRSVDLYIQAIAADYERIQERASKGELEQTQETIALIWQQADIQVIWNMIDVRLAQSGSSAVGEERELGASLQNMLAWQESLGGLDASVPGGSLSSTIETTLQNLREVREAFDAHN